MSTRFPLALPFLATLPAALLLAPLATFGEGAKIKRFDLEAIRDPKTLALKVLQDWHVVTGPISTRQKLATIDVGEIRPGPEYRIPVKKMIVPADRKAKGFHLTGEHSPDRLEKTRPVNPLEQELMKGEVGLVYTVVQEPGSYGQGALGGASEARFAKSLNPRYKTRYWARPATLLRAVTTADAEREQVEPGNVAISDGVLISRNLPALRARGVEILFHPGTHDMVACDLAWGGAHHPDIPVNLGVNTGHGEKTHPQLELDERNRDAFLLRHFFPEKVDPLLTPPVVQTQIDGDALKVTVCFAPGSGEESGRSWWIDDRAPDGSPKYLSELIPKANTAEMRHEAKRGVWTAELKRVRKASRLDFFTNHRKTLRYEDKTCATHLPSPYTRVTFRKE